MPTGKQNTFANRTIPDMIYVTIRKDQPINLSGAFEKAIASRDGGYVSASEKALKSYCEKLYGDYDMSPDKEFTTGTDLWGNEVKFSLPEMLNAIENAVADGLS